MNYLEYSVKEVMKTVQKEFILPDGIKKIVTAPKFPETV